MTETYLGVVEALLLPRLPPTGIVMDLACGNGSALALLRARHPGLRLLGYERDGTLLQQARDRALSDVTLARFDLTLDRPPPAAGRVDGVLGSGVMDVLTEPASLLGHLRRLMRANSVLLLHEGRDGVDRMAAWVGALTSAGFHVEHRGTACVLAVSPQNLGAIRGWE